MTADVENFNSLYIQICPDCVCQEQRSKFFCCIAFFHG